MCGVMSAQWGKKRSSGVNILLFIVTLGVYWFVWLYKTFGEVARVQQRDLNLGTWIGILAVAYALSFTASVVHGVQEIQQDLEERSKGEKPDFAAAFKPRFTGVYLASVVLNIVLYLLQIVLLIRVTNLVSESFLPLNDPYAKPPPVALAVLFCVLYAVGWIPYVGLLFTLAALVLSIIWVVAVQRAVNRYWDVQWWRANPRPPAVPTSPVA